MKLFWSGDQEIYKTKHRCFPSHPDHGKSDQICKHFVNIDDPTIAVPTVVDTL